MLKVFSVYLIMLAGLLSCKSGKKTAVAAKPADTSVSVLQVTNGAYIGQVSHNLKKTCGTTIRLNNADEETYLIPSVPLSPVFDQDGLKISFNYRTLRMPQPEGCLNAIPAEITDIQVNP